MNAFSRTAGALVVAAGLFGYIYFVESKKEAPKPTDGDADATPRREKVFTAFDKLKVRSFTLKRRGGDIVHAEKTGDVWAIVSPQEVPADAGEVGMLLDALQSLETEESLPAPSSDLAQYGLTEPKVAVSVVAEGAAKPFEFELGDAVPAGTGIFARVPGRPQIFTVSSTLQNTLDKSAFDLRDRALLKVKAEGVASFETFEKGKSLFRIARGEKGQDDWKVLHPVSTRAARWSVDSFLGLIENLRMEKIVTETPSSADLKKFGLAPAARKVLVNLSDGKSVTLEIGNKSDDGKYYAREAASPLIATIATAIADDLEKGLKNLRAARLLDVATYEVSGLDVITAAGTRTFAKSTVKGKDGVDQIVWKSTAPVKDATQEQMSDALLAIGGIDSAEFVDAPKPVATYGLDAPALRVNLRFEGEKAPDWFEVSIKGDDAFARRRDDSAILKIDKTKTEALLKAFTALGS